MSWNNKMQRRKRKNCTNCLGAGYFYLHGVKLTCPSCHPSGRVLIIK